ncbi:MAG: RluA family pseudouridine synthase [Proteobacteria bacterium]|nr:RluA family pseudouridine synthase [Pseudomonadota bacterium]
MFRVVYEDENCLGIDKLLPIPSIRQGTSSGLSDDIILEYPMLSKILDFGFTHRLDNETLGVMLIAKNANYYEKIRELFRNKKVDKTYHARVRGVVSGDEGVIDDPIAHSKKSIKKMTVIKPGYRIYRGEPRPAITSWKVLNRRAELTDLELKAKTGVRHQIRVHLQSIGHPICGDPLYSDYSEDYPSLMLISKVIVFKCPVTEKEIKLMSTLNLDNMFDSIR